MTIDEQIAAKEAERDAHRAKVQKIHDEQMKLMPEYKANPPKHHKRMTELDAARAQLGVRGMALSNELTALYRKRSDAQKMARMNEWLAR